MIAVADTIQTQFEKFHRDNPQVYRWLRKLALDLKARGYKVGGIKMLWEVLRWQTMMRTVDVSSDFKLNNNYSSRYARLLMENEEALKDFFEIREIRTS
jgi:hypothetical protein